MSIVTDQIVNHLEFLGYKIERDEDSFFARHSNYFNIHYRETSSGLRFGAIFSVNDAGKENRAAVLEAVNNYNQRTYVNHAYLDKDFDVIFEANFPIIYDKEVFGVFMSRYNQDFSSLGAGEPALSGFLK